MESKSGNTLSHMDPSVSPDLVPKDEWKTPELICISDLANNISGGKGPLMVENSGAEDMSPS